MTYTNFTSKVIEQAWGVFDLTLTGTVATGDLCTMAGVKADSDVASAQCVALEDGVSGDVIKAAMGAVVRKPSAQAVGGGVTAGSHAGAAGTRLYLSSTAGLANESSGTIVQTVGWCVDTERVLLNPYST